MLRTSGWRGLQNEVGASAGAGREELVTGPAGPVQWLMMCLSSTLCVVRTF